MTPPRAAPAFPELLSSTYMAASMGPNRRQQRRSQEPRVRGREDSAAASPQGSWVTQQQVGGIILTSLV